jgi:hypothetical protein
MTTQNIIYNTMDRLLKKKKKKVNMYLELYMVLAGHLGLRLWLAGEYQWEPKEGLYGSTPPKEQHQGSSLVWPSHIANPAKNTLYIPHKLNSYMRIEKLKVSKFDNCFERIS